MPHQCCSSGAGKSSAAARLCHVVPQDSSAQVCLSTSDLSARDSDAVIEGPRAERGSVIEDGGLPCGLCKGVQGSLSISVSAQDHLAACSGLGWGVRLGSERWRWCDCVTHRLV